MNTMKSCQDICPNGAVDTMCRVVVDTLPCTLELGGSIPCPGTYAVQLWIRSEAAAGINVYVDTPQGVYGTSKGWSKYIKVLTASETGAVHIDFLKKGIYHIYHAKVEAGENISAWTSYDDEEVLSKPVVFGTVKDDMSAKINVTADDTIGMIYEIHCKGTVINPVIYHIEANQSFRLNGSYHLDDVITIDTRNGKKSVYKNYRGTVTNLINKMDRTSKWLQLQPGSNTLIQTADTGAEYMDSIVTYTNEYEGV